MSAVERLQAAIEKLEMLRNTSDAGGWRVREELWEGANRWEIEDHNGFSVSQDGDGIGAFPDLRTPELIVTLHRTIDVQLAILRHIATHYSGDLGIGTNRHVVALADAILGDQS